MASSLILKQICKTYGANEVLKGIDLTVPQGDFLVLVGPSGCGKSTLLRCIAGLEEITSGDLYIGDRRVNDVAPKERDIAMVFQSYALYPHMTVYENLSFALRIRRTNKQEILQRVEQAAQLLGLSDLLERYPRQLSGGQRQRVAMGRAIVRHPKVFLFDEPLSNLDAALRVQMRAELARLHHRLNATMVYVTHDQVEAMTLADRIVVLNAGILQQVGAPLELYHCPANLFVAGFIGSPSMNFVKGHVVGDNKGCGEISLVNAVIVLPNGRLFPNVGTNVVVGIRPEDLALVNDGSGQIAGTVEVVEPMGFEAHVHVRIGAHTNEEQNVSLSDNNPIFVVRIGAEKIVGLVQGSLVSLRMDPERIHLFLQDSGIAVGEPAAARNMLKRLSEDDVVQQQ